MSVGAFIVLGLLLAPGVTSSEMLPTQGAEGALALIAPNGSEYWIAGETHAINWTGGGPGLGYALLYSNFSNLGPWKNISRNASSPFNWSVPDDRTNSAWVRVEARNATGALVAWDVSDNPFTIERAPEKRGWVVWPNGGERFANGSSVFIRWDSEYGAGARASLAATCDGAASNFTTIGENLSASGQHLWAANVTGGGCFVRLRISDALVSHTDYSDEAFQVYERPRIEIVSPSAGSKFAGGGSLTLKWNSSGGASRLLVNVTVSWRGENRTALASGLEDPGRLQVGLPEFATDTASIRIEASDELGNNASDEVGNITLLVDVPHLGSIQGILSTPYGPLLNGQLFLYTYSNDSPPALVQVGTSGADGNFTFVQLLPGLYLLEADSPGYNRTGAIIAVHANRTTWANLTFRAPLPPGIDTPTAWALAYGILLAGLLFAVAIVAYRRWSGKKDADREKPPGSDSHPSPAPR